MENKKKKDEPTSEQLKFAKLTLDYVYKSKLESNERAEVLITSNTFLIMALSFLVSFVPTEELFNNYLILTAFIVSLLAAIAVLTSLFFAIRTVSPKVSDSNSFLESEYISKFKDNYLGYKKELLSKSDEDIVCIIAQEIIANSVVKKERANLVNRSGFFVQLSLVLILIASLIYLFALTM